MKVLITIGIGIISLFAFGTLMFLLGKYMEWLIDKFG